MIAISLNEDESINVDVWGPRLEAARAIRAFAWDDVVLNWLRQGHTLSFDPEAVRTLFCDLRIDARRAHLILDAQGDTSVTTIDPAPEEAAAGTNQLIADEIINQRLIFQALRERHGITTFALGHEPHADLWISTLYTLRDEGKLLPGMRGF